MTTTRRKRLIEVAFPLEEVSAHSRREKNIRKAHISTLHIWWARRPLAACRAFIYASLVNDPSSDAEREELLKEVADLASWDAVRHPDRIVRKKSDGGTNLTGTQLLERARHRILNDNEGKPPKLLDPFAGGGAIPLEGMRLGCEVEASDLNPVAVLILKGTVEYPQKYGQPNSRPVPDYIRQAAQDPSQGRFDDGNLVDAYRRNPLAADVRYWGHWMLEKARNELSEFYPPDPDGSVPAAYLWSRTIPCPSCRADMPLIRQYWLARKKNKQVALKPTIDRENNRVDFKVVEGPNVTGDPAEATTSAGDSRCLICGQVVKAARIRALGWEGRILACLTSVVLTSGEAKGKKYRSDSVKDHKSLQEAAERLHEIEALADEDLPLVPDEPMPRHLTGGVITAFGYDTFGKLFNARQLLSLITCARLVREAHIEMLGSGLGAEYAKAVATYLGLAVDRLANQQCTISRWDVTGESLQGAFARQALPMVWDYAEGNVLSDTTGSLVGALDWICPVVEHTSAGSDGTGSCATVAVRDASVNSKDTVLQNVIVTDPPYYHSINYADLSDFFYVWLKRSVGALYPELLSLPLTPKREQVVMNVHGSEFAGKDRKSAARQRYVDGMAKAFQAMAESLEPDGITGVVFAHTDPDAWATLVQGLLEASLVPDASWPIDTELPNKVSGIGQARLSTSVWMACRKRDDVAAEAFLGDVMEAMRPVVRERLLYFWTKGVRGADFFISAIGPALSVFGRYDRVLRPDGTAVTVRDFLDIVRRESTTVALEQVLHGADLGAVDPVTRQYVTWVWSYSRSSLDSGEAIALSLATGASYTDTVRAGSIAVEGREKRKKVARLRTIRQRASEDDDLGQDTAARPAPLIDQLQYAAWLWGQNRTGDLGSYRGSLGETRWEAVRTLGQAVAECLPDGDEDRRIILGLLGSNVMATAAPANGPSRSNQPAGAPLPGFETEEG